VSSTCDGGLSRGSTYRSDGRSGVPIDRPHGFTARRPHLPRGRRAAPLSSLGHERRPRPPADGTVPDGDGGARFLVPAARDRPPRRRQCRRRRRRVVIAQPRWQDVARPHERLQYLDQLRKQHADPLPRAEPDHGQARDVRQPDDEKARAGIQSSRVRLRLRRLARCRAQAAADSDPRHVRRPRLGSERRALLRLRRHRRPRARLQGRCDAAARLAVSAGRSVHHPQPQFERLRADPELRWRSARKHPGGSRRAAARHGRDRGRPRHQPRRQDARRRELRQRLGIDRRPDKDRPARHRGTHLLHAWQPRRAG